MIEKICNRSGSKNHLQVSSLTLEEICAIQEQNTNDYLKAQRLNESDKPDLTDLITPISPIQQRTTKDYLTATKRNSISTIDSMVRTLASTDND